MTFSPAGPTETTASIMDHSMLVGRVWCGISNAVLQAPTFKCFETSTSACMAETCGVPTGDRLVGAECHQRQLALQS